MSSKDIYSSDEYDDAHTGNDAPTDDKSARGFSDLAPSSPGNSIDVFTPSTLLSLMSAPASITESEDQDEDELMSTSTSSSVIILAALEKIAALFTAEHDRVHTTRTLFRNPSAPQFPQIPYLWWCRNKSPAEFRRLVRISPTIFGIIENRIAPDPIFRSGPTGRRQTEVRVQLAVFLYHLGHYGNATSVSSIADWAGIANGSVINFSNPAQIKSARSMAVTQSGCEAWSGGYLAVDGTAIKLYQKLGLFGESWFNKSSNYAVALQIVILLDSLEITPEFTISIRCSYHAAIIYSQIQRTQ
ncbi:hypothetical protein OBBRIDRAFT_834122 [Obba rivulosa]|uniref:Uncharacterized protein n=1 Tax=Obba rivulosa TaxID=1052685 RepID=A0A8E2B3I0_9APHY|nr:hypothetical protein OBBRIDRAFT_834122 [Obba rivulosa]